jgi:hypothetical protein
MASTRGPTNKGHHVLDNRDKISEKLPSVVDAGWDDCSQSSASRGMSVSQRSRLNRRDVRKYSSSCSEFRCMQQKYFNTYEALRVVSPVGHESSKSISILCMYCQREINEKDRK